MEAAPDSKPLVVNYAYTANTKDPETGEVVKRIINPGKAFDKTVKEILDIPHHYDGFSRDVLSREIYERNFGIHPHPTSTDPDCPSPLVVQKDATQLHLASQLRSRIFSLVRKEVPKRTGMSVLELMSLPVDILLTVEDVVDEYNNSEAAAAAAAMEDLKGDK